MFGRQERIAVFEGTRDLCLQNPFLKNAISASRRNQRIYWEGDVIEYGPPRFSEPAEVVLPLKKPWKLRKPMLWQEKGSVF